MPPTAYWVFLGLCLLVLAGFVVYTRAHPKFRRLRRLLHDVRDAAPAALREWPTEDLATVKKGIEDQLKLRNTEEDAVKLGYQLGRVSALLAERDADRINGYIAEEEARQIKDW